jgi:WD40 repeat protein
LEQQPSIEDLVSQWHQLLQEGQSVSIEQLCAGAPERLEALRQHLRDVASMQAFLELSSDDSPTGGRPDANATLGEPTAPYAAAALFGEYEVLGELGRGGMGVVYKARQAGLNRLVALKVILAGGHAHASELARFRTEAELLARLRHPNIVAIYEIGAHQGQPFLALEYLEAGSLAQHLQRAPLHARAAGELCRTLARAMQAAHAAGVIHRDLKPANVLLTSDGTPKITDFGLAKQMDTDQGQTRTGAVMGTPNYMAPEQARGAKGIGPATDIYALGAVLYDLLTGRPPFRGASLMETLDQVMNHEAVPPRRLQPTVPLDLETICLRCLSKEPARRYGSAAALADDLDRYLQGEPILARPTGNVERLVKWARRRPAVAALYGVSAAALVALMGLGFWFSVTLGASQGVAEAARTREAAARTETAAAESNARAARELADTREYYRLLSQARERRAEPQPGWTWAALDDLTAAARLAPAGQHVVERRSDLVNTLSATDVRLVRALAPGFTAHCLAFDPTGRYLALGQSRAAAFLVASVQIVDIEDKAPPRQFTTIASDLIRSLKDQSQDGIRALAFSPDGRWLIAGTAYGQLCRWDLTQEGPPQAVQGHAQSVHWLVCSPDGTAVYSAGKDQVVKRWSSAGWNETASFKAASPVMGLAVHPREGWVICGTGDDFTHYLDADSLQEIRPPQNTRSDHVRFGPGGGWMVHTLSTQVNVVGPIFGRSHATLQLPRAGGNPVDNVIGDLSLSADGGLVLGGLESGKRARLWEIASGRLVADLPAGAANRHDPVRVAFDPRGRRFAVTAGGQTHLYEVAGHGIQSFTGLQGAEVRAAALHPDGGSIASASVSELDPMVTELHLRKVEDGADAPPAAHLLLRAATDHLAPLLAVPRDPLSIVAAHGKSLVRWERLKEHVLPQVVPGDAQEYRALGLTPDDRLWTAEGGKVHVRQLADGKAVAAWDTWLQRIQAGTSWPSALAAGCRCVVVGGHAGFVTLLDATTAKENAASRDTHAAISSVALCRDETLAAAGSDLGELFLIQVPGGRLLHKQTAHHDRISALAFAGEHLLASASRDGTLVLWDCTGGHLQELWSQRVHSAFVWLAFHPDGVRLFGLLEGERSIRVWHLDRLEEHFNAQDIGIGLKKVERPAPMGSAEGGRDPLCSDKSEASGGLRVELFADPFMQHRVKVRHDPQLDWRWDRKGPDPMLPVNWFSARWTGRLQAPAPGRYRLRLHAWGFARLWLDDKLRLDLPVWQPVRHMVEVELTGRAQRLRVEYLHGANATGAIVLLWAKAGEPQEVPVPASGLIADDPPAGP